MSDPRTEVTAPPALEAQEQRASWRSRQDPSTWGPVIALILLFALFSIAKPGVWLGKDNLLSILNDQAILVILACGLTIVVIVGEIDLSIASAMSLGGIFAAGLVAKSHLPIPAVIALTICAGLLIGLVNGILVSIFNVQSIIATLAIGSILDGLTLAYSGGSTIFSGVSNSYLEISRWSVGDIKAPVFYALALAVFLWAFLKYTPVGRSIEATGGNRLAAALAGVRVNRYVILSFMFAGACATFAGMLQTSRNGSAQPLFAVTFLLPAYAGVFLGSMTLRHGQFHIAGTVFGVYLVAVGSAGFVILGAPFYTNYLFSGAVLIFATASGTAWLMVRQWLRRRRAGAGPEPPTGSAAGLGEHETKANGGS